MRMRAGQPLRRLAVREEPMKNFVLRGNLCTSRTKDSLSWIPHGYVVCAETVDPAVARVSHVNVNEGSVEGLRYLNGNVLTVQFHPEASPGPRDTENLFDRFVRRMEGGEW